MFWRALVRLWSSPSPEGLKTLEREEVKRCPLTSPILDIPPPPFRLCVSSEIKASLGSSRDEDEECLDQQELRSPRRGDGGRGLDMA